MRIMKQKLKLATDALRALLIACLIFPQAGFAASTAAGTLITNTASVNYLIGGVSQPPQNSSVAEFLVDEKIEPLLVCASAQIAVPVPSKGDLLQYTLTNNGNGVESFILTRSNGDPAQAAPSYVPSDALAPVGVAAYPLNAIFVESGLLIGLQLPGSLSPDTAYVANTPITLAKGASITVYLLSDTPVGGVAANAVGPVFLTATSTSQTSGVGVPLVLASGSAQYTQLKGAGDASVVTVANPIAVATNAVVMTPNGASTGKCSYIASGAGFTLTKSVIAATDAAGVTIALVATPCPALQVGALCATTPAGSSVYLKPGTTLTYEMRATLSGVGVVQALTVTDPIPPNTTYLAGSIKVDTVAQTDLLDADFGSYDAATQSLKISLGNKTSTVAVPVVVVILFKAVIN
jgi:uncharacterized repeat protein (TIGR01451 family)